MASQSRIVLIFLALSAALAGCASGPREAANPHYKLGAPYKIKGQWYYPRVERDYDETGIASWYGEQFHGRLTANGEIFDKNEVSAAHQTLPLPSLVEVRNLENGRRLLVRVNDRGPFAGDRIIDLSRAAARKLGFEQQGLARVRVRFVSEASLPGERRYAREQSRLRSSAREASAQRSAPPAPTRQVAPSRDIADLLNQRERVASAEQTVSPSQATPETIGRLAMAGPASVEETTPPAPIAPEAAPAAPAPDPGLPIQTAPGVIATSSSPVAAAETRYMIRIAALTRLDNLETMREALAPVGLIRIARVDRPGEAPIYRISLGPYANAFEAQRRLEAVREAGYGDAMIVAVSS